MSDNIKSNISNERLLSVRNVRGTNEELINLSSKFPNVLFYADNTSAGVLKDNNNKDLYLGGFKYTRFHGLGKNMVTIGENRIILSFDESSGLLSIALNSSIDAMWLCGIDDTNSITFESSLSDIKSCMIDADSDNDISKYIYRYNYGVIDNTDRFGMIMFNRGNRWNTNGSFVPNDDGNDSVTLLFALVSESIDLPNIQFNIQNNNNLVSFSYGRPFMIKTPNDAANEITGQVGLSLGDKQNLYICPIKVLIINSGVLADSTVKIDPSILIPVEDDNDAYRSNFYNNSNMVSSTNVPVQPHNISNDDLGYDPELQNFNIFETSPVTSFSDNVLLKCNMFVESTIRMITLTGTNISTTNEEFKIRLNIKATKNANYINSFLFNDNELVKFLVDNGIITFAIQIKNNNGSTVETDEINDENSKYGYIKYEDGSYVYTCKKGTLLAEGLKNINIFLLVKNSDNNHPKFPLIKFVIKPETESVKRLYPLFEYKNLSYFIQPNNNNLSLSNNTSNNSRCIAACNVVNIANSNWIYVSYVSNFNGEITDEHLTYGINYNNVINTLNNISDLSFNEIRNNNVLIVYTGSQIDNIHVSLNIMKVESETNNTSTYIPIDSRYIETGNSNNLSWIYIKHKDMGMTTNADSDIRYVFF